MAVTMKKSNSDFLDTYRQIRKPMPPSEKVIPNEKDIKKKERFDWKNIDEDEEGEEYKGIANGN